MRFLQHLLHPNRHQLARRAEARFVEPVRALAAFEVELQRAGAMALGPLDEAGRRIDRAARADRDEQVRPGDGREDP